MYIPLFIHQYISFLKQPKTKTLFLLVHVFVFCLFVRGLSLHPRIFHSFWNVTITSKGFKFDLYPTLMAIEQCGFFNVPNLLRHEPTLYNGHLRWPLTYTLVAERFGTEAVHSCFKDMSVLGIELWSSACEANALIYATAAVFVQIYMWQG